MSRRVLYPNNNSNYQHQATTTTSSSNSHNHHMDSIHMETAASRFAQARAAAVARENHANHSSSSSYHREHVTSSLLPDLSLDRSVNTSASSSTSLLLLRHGSTAVATTTTTAAAAADGMTMLMDTSGLSSIHPEEDDDDDGLYPVDDSHELLAGGALQFMPAFQESTNRRTTSSSTGTTTAPPKQQHHVSTTKQRPNQQQQQHYYSNSSWDAILEEKKDPDTASLSRPADQPPPQHVRSYSQPDLSSLAMRARDYKRNRRPTPTRRRNNLPGDDDATSLLLEPPPPQQRSTTSTNNTRMSRIASLFSSRAVTENTTTAAVSTPSSPARSSSSSGGGAYVGWPGTQDKRGGTVTIQSSYDDSSVGAAAQQPAATATVSSFVPDDHHDVVVDQEQAKKGVCTRWTTRTKSPSQQRQPPPREYSSSSSASSRVVHPARRSSSTSRAFSALRHHHDANTALSSENKNQNNNASSTDLNLAAVVADARAITNRTYAKSEVLVGNNNNHDIRSSSNRAVLPAPNRIGTRHWQQHKHNYTTTNKKKSTTAAVSFQQETAVVASPATSSGGAAKTSSSTYSDSEEMARFVYPSLKANPRADYGPTTSSSSSSSSSSFSNAQQQQQQSSSVVPPTEEYLAANDQLQPPHRPFASSEGYRGLMDKTQNVPSLMDQDSDSMASKSSSKATSNHTYSTASGGPRLRGIQPRSASHNHNHPHDDDAESDVFDDLSVAKESDVFDNITASPRRTTSTAYPERIIEEDESGGAAEFKLVHLAGGLTTIQSTRDGFSNRRTASDFDENLTNSEVDQNGFHQIPGFYEMVSAGLTCKDNSLSGIQGNFGTNPPHHHHYRHGSVPKRVLSPPPQELTTSGSSDGSSLFTDPYDNSVAASHYLDTMEGDLSEYYVNPRDMKKLVRRYRILSERIDSDMTLDEFEREEDEHKAFALFEMRSRIMEKDIERGLERRGGTVVVDDIVTTTYNRSALRIRDAVIVSKAWRDGASPLDVMNSSLLTRRADHTYFIKRPLPLQLLANDSSSSRGYSAPRRYEWEAVRWVDDTDFMQYRCPSLGPRHMRGFEMFTVGDCQSILLKLTNEQCLNLREELDDATRRQIQAEDLLRQEGDGGDDMMTEAEMTYLSAMEEVKTISKKLVTAEQSFRLVRDRIQELVTRYQEMLVKIETESLTGASSIMTYESSYYSEPDSEQWAERERAVWARRAQRAEVRAELAAREALMAKQEARMIQEEKQRELEALQHRLNELQSESSAANTEKEFTVAIVQGYSSHPAVQDNISEAVSRSRGIDKQKIDGVKQRFRDRIAARKRQVIPKSPPPVAGRFSPRHQKSTNYMTPSPPGSRNLFRSAGEEMFQQMDFYERSLRAVDQARVYP